MHLQPLERLLEGLRCCLCCWRQPEVSLQTWRRGRSCRTPRCSSWESRAFRWNPAPLKKNTQQLKSHSSQYKKINYCTTWNVAHVHTWKYKNGASKDMLGRKGGAREAERWPEKKPTAVFVSMPLPIAFHKQCLGEKASINVNNCSLLHDPWPICKLTQFLNYIHLQMVRTIQKIGIFCGALSEQITGFLSLPNLSATPGTTSFTEEHGKITRLWERIHAVSYSHLGSNQSKQPGSGKARAHTTCLPTVPKREKIQRANLYGLALGRS